MKKLIQTWRWFGPDDKVILDHARQAGAEGIVSALHDIPSGEVWPFEEIIKHKKLIEEVGLRWTVVESLPIHEDIKTRSGNYKSHIQNYKESLRNLSKADISIVTYNFMPVVDWTRTNLDYKMADGSTGLLFDIIDFAVFDLHILQRPGSENDYSSTIKIEAAERYETLETREIEKLTRNIIAGLPGSTTEGTHDLERFRKTINRYQSIDEKELQENLFYFLESIIPTAEECRIQLAIHPDDPPFSLFGIPRIMSHGGHLEDLFSTVSSPCNGLCFCTGSFGVRADNDLVKMIDQYGDRIFFIHLRSTKRSENGSFFEADHLDGDVNMYDVMRTLVDLQQKKQIRIPMRPDHGHKMLDDLQKNMNPGYSAVGRLRGLAELRGLEHALLYEHYSTDEK